MLNLLLLDRFPLRGHKDSTDALGEKFEEGNWVLNVLEVRGGLDPASEAPPLAPGGSVFLEDVGRETLGDFLLCSMLVSC